MADIPKVVEILGVLAAAYPNFNLPEETIEVYARLLSDLPAELLEAGAKHHIATEKWFPSISELRNAVFTILRYRNGLPEPGEAWAEVQSEIKRVGSYGQPEFSSDIVRRSVAAMGGWRNVCLSEDMMVDRAHFLKIYASLRDRAEEEIKMLDDVKALADKLDGTRSLAQLAERVDDGQGAF